MFARTENSLASAHAQLTRVAWLHVQKKMVELETIEKGMGRDTDLEQIHLMRREHDKVERKRPI